jgi:protocatechuate 3,4-dioxygenase beta subunit
VQNSRAALHLILLLALPLAAQTDGAKTASVQGTVTDSVTGLPVPRAHVSLRGMNGNQQARYGATSAADGRFTFSGLAPGNYIGEADRVGYVRFRGISPHDRTMVTLKADDSKIGVDIQLTPTGSITGRVTDSNGEPVEDAAVSAEGGIGDSSGTTDEKGLFRIGGLTPGKYSIRASQNKMFGGKPEIRTDGTTEAHDAATYHPSVLTVKVASKVTVRPGGETTGVDIQLVRVPFVRVSGRVVDMPGNAQQAHLMVSQDNEEEPADMKVDGSFELWRLDPGKYTLSAEWETPNGESVQTVGVEIDVAGSNIDNVELRVIADSDIPGRLEFEDDEAKQTSGIADKRVSLETFGGFNFGDGAEPAVIDADGAFHLKKVPAGKYKVQVSWGTSYVRSMRLGSTAIEGAVLDLRSGSGGADLTIVMGAANGSVSGTVTDESGHAAGLMVVLAGDDEDGIGTRSTGTKADGSYSFDHLAPGDYHIVAVPESDMAMEGTYEDQMESVKVRPKEKVTKDLKLRPPAVQ